METIGKLEVCICTALLCFALGGAVGDYAARRTGEPPRNYQAVTLSVDDGLYAIISRIEDDRIRRIVRETIRQLEERAARPAHATLAVDAVATASASIIPSHMGRLEPAITADDILDRVFADWEGDQP